MEKYPKFCNVKTKDSLKNNLSSPEKDQEKSKESEFYIRDPCFAHIENPFGLEQHVFNIIFLGVNHIMGFYIMYLILSGQCTKKIIIFEVLYGTLTGIGITAGAHRLWAHKTYKAKEPLKILLMLFFSTGMIYPIFKFSVEHRVHHKFTDTAADLTNVKKGFWWSHCLWLFYPKSKEHLRELARMDMRDLESDPVVRFQSQYYFELLAVLAYLFPATCVWYIYEVPLFWAFCSSCMRFLFVLHNTLFISSLAHIIGYRPYDKNVSATDDIILSIFTSGEGSHNFHHTFPWDYRSAEFGRRFNLATIFIEMCAKMGWAYDMKMVSREVLEARVKRTGDGSRSTGQVENANQNKEVKGDSQSSIGMNVDKDQLEKALTYQSWGWDDDKMPSELRAMTSIINAVKL